MNEYGGCTTEEYAKYFENVVEYFNRMGGNKMIKGRLYTADWCQPCQQMKGIIKEITEEYPEIKITILDVEKHKDIAVANHVRGLPTLTIDDENGFEVRRFNGLTRKEEIIKAFKEAYND